jgi:hypothetical protein
LILTCWGLRQPLTRKAMQIDGVTYQLNWDEFTVGSSFFVPCLDDVKARERIEQKMKRLGYATIIKLVIEDNIRGLRIWRVKRVQLKRNL